MSICPKCGKKIKFLNNYQSGEDLHRLYCEGDYEHKGFIANNQVNDFACPECKAVLFNDERKAKRFLEAKK
jgi:predicted RNA-binding Zn-ribbon protein involved in translation (DUF1610 family)